MATIINTVFRLKRGTAARWSEVNPILDQGEPGFILDENRLKIGDGIHHWNDLPYLEGESEIFSADTKQDFPIIGKETVIYKAEKEKKLYQWNNTTQEYEELNFTASIVPTNKYEVFSKPEETIVNIDNNEIRIWCNGNFKKQQSSSNANSNFYYIGVKIYAPNKNIYSFKESFDTIITDNTMYYFEENEFAGIDEDGRKFSIIWLPVASYDESMDSWIYFGDKSTLKKFFGWDYVVDWYDNNETRVATDSIRINLSNENCHYINEPYYMSSINVNKLIQDENSVLILYGGSATDNILKEEELND